MEEKRPKIKIESQTGDNLLEIGAIAALIFTITYVIINYAQMPARIPTHFNFSGQVDGYGDKSSLLFLPVVPVFLYTLFTIINRYPHVFNYPVKITQENAAIQYELGTRLMRSVKFIIMALFASLSYEIIGSTYAHATTSSWWMLPVEIAVLFVVIGVYWRAALKNENKQVEGAITG